MQKSACILYRSRGNRIKRPTNFDMSLVTQWKEVTSRATSFGRHGLQNDPSGALMPGKVIGCGWTHVLTWLRWKSNTSLMPFASTHKDSEAAAIQALDISSCRVSKDVYLEILHMSTFSLTSRRIPAGRKAATAKREVDWDMVAREESASEVSFNADSGWLEVSDNSSTDSECTDMEVSSIASDQNRFDTAYEAFQNLANDLYYIDFGYSRGSTSEDAAGVLVLDGYEKLQEMVHLPRTWPLARLTIPLLGLSKQIDRLLEGYCFQILAANRCSETHNGRVLQTAMHLTWILAEYLSDTIAWLMRSILGHDSKIVFDKDTQLLLTPKFWILPLY